MFTLMKARKEPLGEWTDPETGHQLKESSADVRERDAIARWNTRDPSLEDDYLFCLEEMRQTHWQGLSPEAISQEMAKPVPEGGQKRENTAKNERGGEVEEVLLIRESVRKLGWKAWGGAKGIWR